MVCHTMAHWIPADSTIELSFPGFIEVTENLDYHKTNKLSEGAMGEVWTCNVHHSGMHERSNANICVAKVSKRTEARFQDLFQQEVTISYHLREHPNIAKTVGFSRDPFTLLMRYYPEGSLDALIHREKSIPGFQWSMRWCISFAKDIASGLAHVHARGIAHCDIKPANILLKVENQSVDALLSDFGIARILDGRDHAVAGLQFHNMNGASVLYAGPEVLLRLRQGNGSGRDAQLLTIKAGDLYSMATVIYEMLAQRKPWSLK